MTPDSDAERAWEATKHLAATATPTEARLIEAVYKAGFVDGRQSLLDDHPAVLRERLTVLEVRSACVVEWIEEADQHLTPFLVDDSGMVQSYVVTAGRWNRLLRWAREHSALAPLEAGK